ncbi:MAG: nuclear transport factor 2 family protein [Flavobacteriaceae bacterium]
MRTALKLLFLLLLIYSCKEKKTLQDTSVITTEIDSLLNQWHKDAAKTKYTNYFNAMDSISVFIGTDASENWNKSQFMKFSKPYFDKGSAWSFKAFDRNIYVSSNQDVVWFDELLQTWMGTCRGSGVLEKNEDTWKIKHYVLSVSIPNDDIQEIIQVKKKKDSIFLKEFKK